jgi:dihydrofolate reductase
VVSGSLTSLTWANSQLVPAGDVPGAVRALKADGEGTISVLGSSELLASLAAHDLIDEHWLFVHPVVLGSGKRLFHQAPRLVRLRLEHCVPTSTGVLMLHYIRE